MGAWHSGSRVSHLKLWGSDILTIGAFLIYSRSFTNVYTIHVSCGIRKHKIEKDFSEQSSAPLFVFFTHIHKAPPVDNSFHVYSLELVYVCAFSCSFHRNNLSVLPDALITELLIGRVTLHIAFFSHKFPCSFIKQDYLLNTLGV